MSSFSLIIGLFFTFISLNVNCQITYSLPEGYETFKDFDQKEVRADGDFDNDGVSDLAILCTNEANTIVVVYLASKWMINESYWWFPWESIWTEMDYSSNELIISGSFGNGRYGSTLKFKYYSQLNNMRLIGYNDSYIGDDMNKDAYDKTINLLTNECDIGGVKRSIKIDKITLSNVEQYFEYLGSVGANYIGN
jgi:hypothetical protein